MTERFVLHRLKDVMWALAAAALVLGVGRFAFGLAASTNMMDSLPWGWWKIFNMVAGAAVATSGFVMAAFIYIFRLHKFRVIAKLSVLIGFLGYGASLTALIFDIGLPHRGWHPFFMWNPHSFLFEVFWCVSLYWGVTALELLPIITEKLPFPRFTHFMHEVMLPFVVLGITLSTMHHSSLGSLFLLSPTRLHPLWHTLWLPPEFFISAMGAGAATILLVMLVTSWLYRRDLNMLLLNGLAKTSGALLTLYLIVKAADLTVHDKWNFVFGPDYTWESVLFQVEILLQAIIPVALFALPSFRRRIGALYVASTSAFVGLVLHRLNTGVIGYFRSSEAIYIPNLSEFVLSFGVISAAGLLFFFLFERFGILDDPAEHGAEGHDVPAEVLTRKEFVAMLTGPAARRALVIALVVIPVTWVGFRHQATGAFQPIEQEVDAAILGSDVLRTRLRLDGDRDGDGVNFPHKKHHDKFMEQYGLEREQTCIKCHHLNLPNDNSTPCRVCHRDMDLDTPMFRMENHRTRFRNEWDLEDFLALDLDDRMQNFLACMKCHSETMKGLAEQAAKGFSHLAPGFRHAMHGACMTCHRLAEKDPADPMSPGNCLGCHEYQWKDENLKLGEDPTEEEAAVASAERTS